MLQVVVHDAFVRVLQHTQDRVPTQHIERV